MNRLKVAEVEDAVDRVLLELHDALKGGGSFDCFESVLVRDAESITKNPRNFRVRISRIHR